MWRFVVLAGSSLCGCDVFFPLNDPPPGDGAVDADLRGCPDSYTLMDRYRVGGFSTDWENAELTCELDSPITHLIVPDTLAEITLLSNVNQGEAGWVGIARDTNSTPNDFRTITGDPFPNSSQQWVNGQPDAGANEFVVESAPTTGRLRDADGATGRAFICECDDRPPIPFDFTR